MGKILIIGVGGAGANTVKRMKEVGIPNAEYITMGDYMCDYRSSKIDIPHYNLIRMSGVDSIPAGSDSEQWREVAENAKVEIKEVIEYHLNKK